MKKFNFIWIDDDPERKSNAGSIEANLEIHVDFVDIKGMDVKEVIEIIHHRFRRKEPDLVLMDHKLDKLQGDHLSTGSSVAELIREIWPACPIVAVTAVDINRDIDLKKRSAYEDVFSIHEISNRYATLISISEGYSRLKMNPPQSVGNLLMLLQVPEDDKERLESVVPADLRVDFGDKSLFPRISQWVRHVLIRKPGFLYDSLWTATLLGIKIEALEKTEDIFAKAEYRGIFCDKMNRRWWPSQVKNILYKKFPQEKYLPPWELGNKLEKVKSKDISSCYACGEPYPETVAFVDDSRSERKPMHLKCTISDPKSQKMLFFEEIRVMKGDN